MSDLATGLAETSNTNASPSVESTPATPPPSTFESLVADLSAEPETTPTEQATTEQPAPATVAPVPPPETPEIAKGEPPKERWPDILENARTKSAAEAEQRVIAQLQQELEPVKPMLSLAQAISQDVQAGGVTGLEQVLNAYAKNPQTAPAFKALMGRALSQMRGAKAPVQDEEPQPDLQTADGELVYSAKQAAKREAWVTTRLKQEIGKEFAPLRELHSRVQKAEQVHQMTAKATDNARSAIQHWSDQPHFKEHAQAIAKEQQALFEQGITDPNVSLGKAYLTVLHRDVLPKQQTTQQEQLAASALAKAAGRGTNPAAVTSSPPPPPKTMGEAFRQVGLTD